MKFQGLDILKDSSNIFCFVFWFPVFNGKIFVCLFWAPYMLDTVLGAEDTAMNKTVSIHILG